MAYSHYDRLSALDASFLRLEDDNAHMHVGSVGIFEAGPLRCEDGSLDVERIRGVIEGTLYRMPRYRQRLAWMPWSGHPVWVDDERFNLSYHLRHASLPPPGDERQLKRLAGRVLSQQLDRGKPLWELWIVEGLEGDRLAVLTKVHHCMVDGVSGSELMSAGLRRSPDSRVPEPKQWVPRPAPGARDFARGELRRRVGEGASALWALGEVARHPLDSLRSLGGVAASLGETVKAGLAPASPTPLNAEIGPHRRFDWVGMELEAVREVKRRLGGTVNDVVLAISTGALRRFLRARGEDVEALDFRALVPVSVRREAEHRKPGNRVASLTVRLPLDARTAEERLARVVEETRRVKQSGQSEGIETLEELSDHTFSGLMPQLARFATRARLYNVTITNVPGPRFPVYMLGAKLLASFPLVPLFHNQALGIALYSYDGRLFWGLNADWDALPDLHDLVTGISTEFEALCKGAPGSGRR